MPLNDERPASTSTSTTASEDPSSDTECSDRCDSVTSSSDFEFSRQSFTSGDSSNHSSPSSSPPKVTTLDGVMASARDLVNLSLAHEIIMNNSFHVEQPNLPQNSLEKKVKDIVHKAFWDCLESELNNDPPEYEHAIRLLQEIREVLLSFLNPGANRLRTQILEVLDVDLIRQQADNNAVDIQGLATYIISVMAKFCAPVRDDEVKKLKENLDNTVVMFKEIFRVLDLMKLDMVNFTIQILRPELQKQSVEYERAKFQSVVERTPNALDHTTAWIKASLETLLAVPTASQSSGSAKSTPALPSPTQIFDTAYIQLLNWDHQKNVLPETLMTDEVRLRELQQRLKLLQTVASILLIVYSTIGGPISGLPGLADRLKKMTSVLLEGMHGPDFDLPEALENVSVQICSELNKTLVGCSYPAISPDVQATLKGQICSILQENNPIRNLVGEATSADREERVQQYFKNFLTAPNSHLTPPPVPGGLALIQAEIGVLGANFISLVNFNKQVYSPFYMGILKDLLFSGMPPNSPQKTAVATVDSQ
ncbi:T-complex protein 11-like protein 2 isoform X1 [Brienomyrus brachyistius]|uniref:T-complex protein 11-like protein 2 isoform X1 n=1 Tax=Brienomyrus brachyistius TaxID=42636 RepID=UPI0020B3583D|nr:T-complex protein 11-like protein 2 isoform X1 [Brienomyrus brachyistius]